MPELLAGLLSEPASELYRRLIVAGRILLEDDEPALEASKELEELIAAGFARRRFVGQPAIIPVEPSIAVDQALMTVQRQLLEQQRMVVQVREQMEVLQRSYVVSSEDAGGGIRLYSDPAEIGSLSVELCMSAEREVSNLETAHYRNPNPSARSAKLPPPAVLGRGVRFRNIYARPVLDLPFAADMLRQCSEGGWELRVLPDVPMKMVLIDERVALLPLDQTGMAGAALIRSPVIVAALRQYFEALWDRAQPVHSTAPSKLSPTQRVVFELMVAGLPDAAIARHLDVSERTVRRHIAGALEAMGADNRITATAIAIRDHWLS